jgi:hypothetical protein
MMNSLKTSRRRFLAQTAAAAGATALSHGSIGQTTRVVDPTSRAVFDEVDASLNDGKGFAGRNNESGQLGWGGSYTSQAYLLMYLAHRDTTYLDKFVAHFDAILDQRDRVRGVKDYEGSSLPAWQAMSDYTCGSVILKDASGRESLLIRTAVRPASDVAVSVERGTAPQMFKLVATRNPDNKEEFPIVDVYDDIHPNSSHAVTRINGDFARVNATPAGPRTMLTASVRSAIAGPPMPTGPVPLSPAPYIFAVHTGQITYPAAGFARLVYQTPDLHAKYKKKADAYIVAIEEALAVSDEEWREDEKTGEGWYVWAKGSPAAFDGAELPHNQYLAIARTMIHLATVAPAPPNREKYKSRATKMARTFKNDLTLGENGAYTWPYFWSKGWGYKGWKESDGVSEYQPMMVHPKIGGHKNIEDTSHAHLDVDFARLAFENDLGVFDETDLERFANTFTRNVLTTNKSGGPTTFANVDGTGAKGSADTIAAGWIPLAKWDDRIFTSVRGIYANREMPKPDRAVALLMGLAYLNRYAHSK